MAGLGLRGFVGGAGGGHFGQRGRDRTVPWPLKPMRDCVWRRAAVACSSCGFGLIEAELRVAVIEFADHLALLDEIADVDGRGDDAAGDQRRDVAGFVGDEGAGLLEAGGDGAGDGLGGGDGDGLRAGRRPAAAASCCARSSRPGREMRERVARMSSRFIYCAL